jgi:biotin carboxyl carrier protein
MPEAKHPGNRTPAQRQTDHASLARLSETLVPALVQKLSGSGLGELEVQEGEWRIRLRRPPTPGAPATRRAERPRLPLHADRDGRGGRDAGHASAGGSGATGAGGPGFDAVRGRGTEALPERVIATSPAVGIFHVGPAVGTKVRAGDAVGTVDLLGIPQDIPSPVDGTLAEVFAAPDEAVEFGEEIAAIEPDPVDPPAPPPVDGGDADIPEGG